MSDGRCVVDRRTSSEEEEGKTRICLNRGAYFIFSVCLIFILIN